MPIRKYNPTSPGVRILASNRVSARDVMNTRRVVLTRAALEKLQEVLS